MFRYIILGIDSLKNDKDGAYSVKYHKWLNNFLVVALDIWL